MDNMAMRGNLVADPTYRVTAGGLHMTKFRIAQNTRRFDRSRGEFVNSDPVYMSVVCWRQLADNTAKSLRKGDSVVVLGRLTMHEYDDPQTGARRQAYEIDAAAVGPDLGRYSASLIRPPRELEPEPVGDASGGDVDGFAEPASAVPEQPVNPWTEPEPAVAETAA